MKIKLISLLSLLISITVIASCISPDYTLSADDSEKHTELDGVYLTLEALGKSSVSVAWHNDTDEEVTFGEWYAVERLTDGEWQGTLLNEMTVIEIAYLLPAHTTLEKGYSLSDFDLTQLGKYRLRCEFWHSGNTYSTWVEFEVAEEAVSNVSRIPGPDISGFSDFLDREGFVARMSQSNLFALAEKYSEGLDESQIPMFYQYDNIYGGGCAASSEIFGYRNDYHAENGKVKYENSLYTKSDLKNLSLPYGITFDDSIGDALEKMGINRNIYQNTVTSHSTDAYDINLTLYSQDGVTLVLTNWALSQAPVETLYHYILTYTETADTDRKDGKITRTVTLSFLDSENKLGKVEMKVVENYRS